MAGISPHSEVLCELKLTLLGHAVLCELKLTLLGYADVRTTEIYTVLARAMRGEITSPLDEG